MKFVMDERDQNYVNNVNKDLSNREDIPLFINRVGAKYYIEFESLDIAKANRFIFMLLSNREEYQKEVQDNLGIKVLSLNFCTGDSKLSELRDYCKKIIEDIDQISPNLSSE